MIALIIAIALSLGSALIFTRVLIRFLTKHQMGQFIRQDGPESHFVKRGTPAMGGVAIIVSTLIGYLSAQIWMYFSQGRAPGISAIFVLGLMVSMGIVGFIDDFAKIRQRQSEGLTVRAKFILQGIIGTGFAVCALFFPDEQGITPANDSISFLSDFTPNFRALGEVVGWILFIIFINLIITAWTNAVNLTDGLDGLAIGVSLFSFVGYMIICFWQFLHQCDASNLKSACYFVRDPWELTIIAGAIIGACFGFLWWNASPAKIFMGDTGSLALGGAFAGLSIVSHTELLAVILGGVFVMEAASVMLQVGFFKWKRKRIFKMAPIHHHFEFKGWTEVNVVIRFWIISALLAALSLGIFYAAWLQDVVFS